MAQRGSEQCSPTDLSATGRTKASLYPNYPRQGTRIAPRYNGRTASEVRSSCANAVEKYYNFPVGGIKKRRADGPSISEIGAERRSATAIDFLENYAQDPRSEARLASIWNSERTYSTPSGKPMRDIVPGTRIVVTIPAYHTESDLEYVLAQYKNQSILNFEVYVLVNGPESVRLNISPAQRSLRKFQAENPKFPLRVATQAYQPQEARIGTIRRDMAAWVLTHAQRMPVVASQKMILLTNDADTISLPHSYLEAIETAFAQDPSLGALSGYCDNPESECVGNPLMWAMRSLAFFEDLAWRKTGHIKLDGGNSAFNLSDYMLVGGHDNVRFGESSSVRNRIRALGRTTARVNSGNFRIAVSGRRTRAGLDAGLLPSTMHTNFGTKSDFHLRESAYYTVSGIYIPETARQISPEAFRQAVELHINERVKSAVESLLRTGKISRPKAITKVEPQLQFIARWLRVPIRFDPNTLRVSIPNTDLLYELAVRKTS